MKKMIKKAIGFTAILCVLLASCSDVDDSKSPAGATNPAVEVSKTCTVSGNFSVGSALPAKIVSSLENVNSSDEGRSATSSFEREGEYQVFAYPMVDDGNDNWTRSGDSDSITGTADASNGTWSVGLNELGRWDIELRFWISLGDGGSSYILTGNTEVIVESLTKPVTSDNIILEPVAIEDIYGAINLEISNTASSVTSVYYQWAVGDGTAKFPTSDGRYLYTVLPPATKDLAAGSSITLNFSDVPNGIYDLTCNFKDEDGNIVYSCIESVNVFSGFTTDTWYASSSSCKHLTDNKFKITDEVLASVTTSKTLSYPIILYDLDTKKKGLEFSDPKPGYSVFETVAEGASVSDGLTLAKGKQISNFTIDPVDQTIFTLEMNAGGSFKSLMKYPSYAGYEVGTAKTLSGYSISSFCSYKGELYFYDSSSSTFYKLVDGKEPVALPLQSSDGTDITLDAYPLLAVDGFNLYLAYEKYDSDYNYYYLYIDKYLISESALTQVATVSKKMDVYGDGVEHPIFGRYNLCLSDIQVSSTKDDVAVYLIVSERGYSSYNPKTVYSRGGIIKVTSTASDNGETHTLAFHDFKTSTDTSSIWIYGWAYDAWHPVLSSKASTTDCSDSNYFYGCTRFLAKKPEELVIADEGGYEYEEEEEGGGTKTVSVNKNRVVTVNLQDFSMSSVDVNAGFDTYYSSSSSCGFAGYSGSGY